MLTFGETPRDEISDRVCLRVISIMAIEKQPGVGHDWIGAGNRRIYNRALQFVHSSDPRRQRQPRGGICRRDKLASLVLQRRHLQAKTFSEAVLDVADRTLADLDAR